jgi:hypothetical protein
MNAVYQRLPYRLLPWDESIPSSIIDPRGPLMELPLEQKRTWVIALMIKCPMGRPLEDCPVEEVRGLSLDNIMKVVGKMTDEEINRVIDHHQQCLYKREGLRFGTKL